MSASTSRGAPNIFAGAFSDSTEIDVIEKTRKFVELLHQAALDHDFSDSVCSQRLRIWEETMNSASLE